MKILEFNEKKDIKLVPFGDLHFGSGFSDYEMIDKTIKKIKKDKDIRVILMGDMIENSSAFSVGTEVYNQKINPTKQFDAIIDLLEPIRDKIYLMHSGNHERRCFRFTGFDAGNAIAKNLKVPYAEFMSLNKINCGSQSYNIFSWHGAGASQNTEGRIRLLQRQAEMVDADIYMMGHVHDLYCKELPKRKVVGKEFIQYMQPFILTGSYTKWDESYAEEHGYKPARLGSPIVKLNSKKFEIEVDLEW